MYIFPYHANYTSWKKTGPYFKVVFLSSAYCILQIRNMIHLSAWLAMHALLIPQEFNLNLHIQINLTGWLGKLQYRRWSNLKVTLQRLWQELPRMQ